MGIGVRPGGDQGPRDHHPDARGTGPRMLEVVGPVDVQRDRVGQHDGPQHRERAEQLALDGDRGP